MDRCEKQIIDSIEGNLTREVKKFRERALSQKTSLKRLGSIVMSLTGISLQKREDLGLALAEVKRRLALEKRAARSNFAAYNLNRHISLKQAYNRLVELEAENRHAPAHCGRGKRVE